MFRRHLDGVATTSRVHIHAYLPTNSLKNRICCVICSAKTKLLCTLEFSCRISVFLSEPVGHLQVAKSSPIAMLYQTNFFATKEKKN